VFTVELPREIRVKHPFYTLKYGKDRISFLSVAFVRGKREIAQKYGKDRKYWIEKPLPREKPLTRFDSYMGIEFLSFWSLHRRRSLCL